MFETPTAEQIAAWEDERDLPMAAAAVESVQDTNTVVNDEKQSEVNTDLEQPDVQDSTESTETAQQAEPNAEVQKDQSAEPDKVEEAKVDGIYTIKAHGQEIGLTLDEMSKLASKGIDYTKRVQELKPWQKTISALKDNGLSDQDVNLMIDAFKGNKDAIAAMLKKSNIDALEIDTSVNATYTPQQHGKDENLLAVEEIVNRISQDAEYTRTHQVVKNDWDESSRAILVNNPDFLDGLHADIKSGMFDKVNPIATKLAALDPSTVKKSSIEYYMEAARQLSGAQQQVVQKQVTVVDTKQNQIKEMSDRRKAATITKNTTQKSVIDYLDESDEAFDDWYKKLQNSH